MPNITDGKIEVPKRAKGSLWADTSPEVLPQCCAPNTVLNKQVKSAMPGGWGADSAQWDAHPVDTCRAKLDPPLAPSAKKVIEANPKPTSFSKAASVSPFVTRAG